MYINDYCLDGQRRCDICNHITGIAIYKRDPNLGYPKFSSRPCHFCGYVRYKANMFDNLFEALNEFDKDKLNDE